DIDADGFAILHELRQAMQEVSVTVTSILMDAVAHARFADMGVNADRRGEPLRARSRRLPSLTPSEQAAYASVASTARVPFRRIEQERIPLDAAVDALRDATVREP
ncbi:MAG: Wadjet anti-phage system protein JetD domain-containing protein, partial [Propioniciclava sp.]